MLKIYIDEAWRWPLAGPLYVGLILPLKRFCTKEFKDSKVLSEKKREELYDKILKLKDNGKILFASWNVTNTVIDQKGLTKSINFSVRKAITAMAWDMKSHCSKRTKKALGRLCFLYSLTSAEWQNEEIKLVIDGKHDFGLSKDLDIETQTIVHGDALNAYISMASIVAKVERDRVMQKFDIKYPEYGFAQHKGYGTEFHRRMMKKFGLCKVHRASFKIKN